MIAPFLTLFVSIGSAAALMRFFSFYFYFDGGHVVQQGLGRPALRHCVHHCLDNSHSYPNSNRT
jgi:hypothetical protein